MFTLNLRDWARRIKRDAVTLWFACRDPATPWLPKALCWFTVAYALSPIDLIPDFIPVLGYLDDVLLLPALIWLAVRLLPAEVIVRSRERAEDWMVRNGRQPTSRVGMALVVGIWVLVAAGLAWWLWTR
ncbi:YkvA family protein [Variovorax sp. EBFNA2]|uniref:YkvA family protein n=1 Tax=Variovorax sp. EBFNA2 TaxID=3342097 RepID=UPI0029C06D4D|nr:YkvA family protein [Variovorax boronicumulans]WPG35662.1 YkvA family protein [Variovorax boronicumulans]